MKNKFAALTFATLLLFAAGLAGCGPKKPELSAADQKKIAALNLAFKSGVLTQQEYDAKLKAINDGAVAANSPSSNGASTAATAQKLQALESACSAGVFTPEECAAKRAAITGTPLSTSGAQSDAGSQSAPPPSASSGQDGSAAPDNSGGSAQANSAGPDGGGPQGGGAGSAYNDPQGNFALMIPQGWKAAPQGPNGAGGVQMSHNRSWAVVAPFSNANQPGDVVNNLAGQVQPQYQNFTVGQHGAMKLNGFDAAVATFTGVNAKGTAVTVVIMGVAGPGGRYFAVMSSVPQGEEPNENPALSSMVQSIRFGGQ